MEIAIIKNKNFFVVENNHIYFNYFIDLMKERKKLNGGFNVYGFSNQINPVYGSNFVGPDVKCCKNIKDTELLEMLEICEIIERRDILNFLKPSLLFKTDVNGIGCINLNICSIVPFDVIKYLIEYWDKNDYSDSYIFARNKINLNLLEKEINNFKIEQLIS